MRACLFPGQGSQFVGMGEGLFARYPEMTAAADAILGYPVVALCLEDPERRLHRTRYTQPALYVVNALAYRSRCDAGLPPPDFLAGHSLGEYDALWAAGVFDFETGLRLVKRRGELMAAAAGGAMAAVLGCDGDRAREVLERHGLHGVDLANDNAPSQVVLSGPAGEIERAEPLFVELGATYVPLKNVGAAFHSRYMEPLTGPLGEALEEVDLQPPRIPVIANVTARPYEPHAVRELLRRQLREPVRWTETVRFLLAAGVDDFEEVGPGSVLTKLVKAVRRHSAAPGAAAAVSSSPARRLGSASFRRDYRLRRAYVAGAIERGVSSKELVVRLGRAGHLGFFGAGGLPPAAAEAGLAAIRRALAAGEPFGAGLPSSPDDPEAESSLVDLCLEHRVPFVEASGFVAASPALVRFRLKGLGEGYRLLARVSRPEVAEAFLAPPPETLVAELLRAGLVTAAEAERARNVPLADDLCVEAEPGSSLTADVLLPAALRQRDEARHRHGYEAEVRVGCAGIGTPEAAAAAFLLGAGFVMTTAVNQCTVEAGTSDDVKDLLQAADVQDTEPAPAAELFELGGRVQVLKKGVLFPGRANRLYDLWRRHGAWEEIAAPVRARIERDCFGRPFERVYEESVRARWPLAAAQAEGDPRHRMALVFRWYCERGMELALAGETGERANYQVRCDPSLGAFNRWVKGTPLASWRRRHADAVADEILDGAAELLVRRLRSLTAPEDGPA